MSSFYLLTIIPKEPTAWKHINHSLYTTEEKALKGLFKYIKSYMPDNYINWIKNNNDELPDTLDHAYEICGLTYFMNVTIMNTDEEVIDEDEKNCEE